MRGNRAATRGAYAATAWLVVWTIIDIAMPSGVDPGVLFALAPLIACAVMSTRAVAVFAVAAGVLVGWSGHYNNDWDTAEQSIRLLDVCLVGAATIGIAHVRVAREHRFARVSAIAETAQKAILPVLPPVIDHAHAAARYVSAAEDATVGGDLYDVCLEGHIRFIVGDVKGKGLHAVEQAARVIRAFRQAAAAKEQLAEVASGMHHYMIPFFGEEEFATALLVELGRTSVTLTSCGHPPAVLVTTQGKATYVDIPAGLPLGIGDDFQQTTIAWQPGDRLLLYTDGFSEARDRKGAFLPLLDIAPQLAAGTPEHALDTLLDAVRGHVPRGHLGDDLAALLLERKADATAVDVVETPTRVTGPQPIRAATPLMGNERRPGNAGPVKAGSDVDPEKAAAPRLLASTRLQR